MDAPIGRESRNEGHNVGDRRAPIASVCGDHHRPFPRVCCPQPTSRGAGANFDAEPCQNVRRDPTGFDPLRVVRVPHRPDASFETLRRKFAAVRQPMLDVEARFPHGDDSRFDRNDVAEAYGLMEARPGLDQRNACEIEPSQEIALRQAGSLENERGLGVEPLKEPRVEDDARGVTIAPLDLPLGTEAQQPRASTD